MTIRKVEPKVDFIALEHEVLDFWKKNQIFEKRRAANEGKPRWSFLDGPITANNPMGVHHAWGRTLKDMYQRYHAMKGYELRYQNGFDCQGLWVEVEVEKELGFKTKREVEDFGIEKFVNLCKQRVEKYSRIQTEQSIRLGYWMDWDHSYYTMSDENNYTIWAFLKKLFNQGKIYRGNDVVPWSGRSGTSYSQMEIIEGRKLVSHEAVFVRFPLRNRDREYLLVWTTTPWTLTSNVAAAVNVDLDYVVLRAADGSRYYFAKENLKYPRLEKQYKEKKNWVPGVPKLKTIEQIFKEHGGYTIEGTLKGAEMIGWEYDGPFDHLEAQQKAGGYPFVDEELKNRGVRGIDCHRVIDGGKDREGNDIVVAGEGTGIVHIAPGCGDIDHQIGRQKGLVNIAPLDEESKYIAGFDWLTGKIATEEETKNAIIEDLKKRGILVYTEQYPHIYPHCWRSGDELVFRIVDEWYINMDWRGKIKKIVDDIEWKPAWGKDREHEWLDNMGDWMISKKRFWGLALPIWTFPDGSFYVVGSKEELKALAVEGWEEFDGHSPHRPWIDKVKIRHPESGLVGTRIKDVGNPWLDAGIVPFSTLGYISNRDYWKKWFPADFITECFPGQFRNWFYSLLAMSALLEEKAPFKTLLGHALVKDETGRDMHKSWGNAIWFDEAAEKMGVDVMRWMYTSQNVEHNLLFGYKHADEVRKKIITLWNVYSFFATYAAVDGFTPRPGALKEQNLNLLDRWVLAKLHQLIGDADRHFSRFQADRFMRKVDRFMEDLSNWYVRRNRRRFWKSEDDGDKQAAYYTLYEVLLNLIKLLAPVLPFITEEIYQNIVRHTDSDAPESVHLCDFPEQDPSWMDEAIITHVDALKRVIELGRSARNKANLKIRQPLESFVFVIEDDNIAEFLLKHQEIVLDELNVKKMVRGSSESELIEREIKPNLPVLGQQFGPQLPQIRTALQEIDPEKLMQEIRENGRYSLEVSGNIIKLQPDTIIVEINSKAGFTAAESDGVVVGLSTTLSDSLKREGLVRDVIRLVQILRKDAGFAVEDRIYIYADFPSEIGAAIEEFHDYFCTETLTVGMDSYAPGEFSKEITVRDQSFRIGMKRASVN